jgi:hypothetical protein
LEETPNFWCVAINVSFNAQAQYMILRMGDHLDAFVVVQCSGRVKMAMTDL